MGNILNKFPALNKNIRLFLSFYNTRIIISGSTEDIEVNNEASKLLLKLNGLNNIPEILEEILQRKPYNEEIVNTTKFIKQLLKKNIITLFHKPKEVKINSEGTLKEIYPKVVSLELTNKCNFNCRYCYQNSNNKKNKFLKDPISILKFLKNKHIVGFELTGGEPLLHPQIYEIISFINTNFSLLGIITNGSLLNERHLKLLKNKSCAVALQVCLDGDNPNMVEETTGVKGSFEMELNAIKLVKKYDFTLRVGMVIDDPEKTDHIENALKIAKNLGADSFIANPALDFGRGKLIPDRFKKEDQLKLHNTIKYLSEKYKGFFSKETESYGTDFEEMTNCGAGHRNITINWDGIMKHCPIISANDLSICHWKDISSERAQKIMRNYYELTSPNKEICNNCKYLPYCFHCTTRAFIAMERKGKEECLWYQKYKDSIDTILNNSLKFTNKE